MESILLCLIGAPLLLVALWLAWWLLVRAPIELAREAWARLRGLPPEAPWGRDRRAGHTLHSGPKRTHT